MPADPTHIRRREVISDDYHSEKVTVDFYTNSAVAIYRGDQNNPDRVWLDNLEKRKLRELLNDQLGASE